MQLLLVAAANGGDYDELGGSKAEGELFIEVWCIQYFWLINK